MANNRYVFVRHGQTDFNLNKYWAGSTNIDINQNGIEQAKQAAVNLKDLTINVAYVSPYQRAQHTFNIINENRNIMPIIDNRIRERSFGDLEGTERKEDVISHVYNWELNSDFGKHVEKIQDLYFNRVKPFIDELEAKYENKTILIVSHGAIGRMFEIYFHNVKDKNISGPKNAEIKLYFSPKKIESEVKITNDSENTNKTIMNNTDIKIIKNDFNGENKTPNNEKEEVVEKFSVRDSAEVTDEIIVNHEPVYTKTPTKDESLGLNKDIIEKQHAITLLIGADLQPKFVARKNDFRFVLNYGNYNSTVATAPVVEKNEDIEEYSSAKIFATQKHVDSIDNISGEIVEGSIDDGELELDFTYVDEENFEIKGVKAKDNSTIDFFTTADGKFSIKKENNAFHIFNIFSYVHDKIANKLNLIKTQEKININDIKGEDKTKEVEKGNIELDLIFKSDNTYVLKNITAKGGDKKIKPVFDFFTTDDGKFSIKSEIIGNEEHIHMINLDSFIKIYIDLSKDSNDKKLNFETTFDK